MKARELIKQLEAYDGETEVRIFDDWGSGYVLRAVSNVLDSTEFEENETPVVVICFEIGTQ